MRKQIDSSSEKFESFLNFYNRLSNESIFDREEVEKFERSLLKYRNEFANFQWDDTGIFMKFVDYLSYLEKKIKSFFPNTSEFFQFLIGQNSISDFIKVYSTEQEDEYVLMSKFGERFCLLVSSLQTFITNFRLMPEVLLFVKSQETINSILKKKISEKRFIPSWTELAVINFALKENGRLEVSLDQNDFFYGFQDFIRIHCCEWQKCQKYFLAKRSDAKYCSANCRYSSNQNIFLSDEQNKIDYLEKRRRKYKEKLENERKRIDEKYKRD
jgi:hypothetical protein